MPQAVASTLKIDKSTNGGVTWGNDVSVQSILSSPGNLTDGLLQPDARARSYPSIGTSPTNSNHVYMVYAADPDGLGNTDDGDIYSLTLER